ncbi:penicillin-binding protein 1A [Desertibaculum subflavum]|uniref:penicillin-binding protein 1A n=1 Tax=Desertibaculum subflavum TaxID=2268458 RepID=UPI003F669A49
MLKRLLYRLAQLFGVAVVLGLIGMAGAVVLLWHIGRDVPDYAELASYQPPISTRVHAGDGRLIAEYAHERRIFVPIDAVPQRVIDAFLSAEDKTFYSHPGIDITGIIRAAVVNALNFGQGKRPVGASTITQQVAKNFLLGNEVTLTRKAKEALLAFRIEQALSKDRILELYLNEIYLGVGAYGIAAASLYYFDKSLDDLTVPEAAFLAALPKAPNNYHPLRYPDRAKARRDWVIDRMAEDGHLSMAEAEAARAAPLGSVPRREIGTVKAEWFAEEVRRELVARYGEKGLYEGGLSVRTSLDPRLQEAGEKALRDGLVDYDRRHGWRGPVARLENPKDWQVELGRVPAPPGPAEWKLAAILAVGPEDVEIGLADGSRGTVPFAELRWARKTLPEQELGPAVRKAADVLTVGDVALVEQIADKPKRLFGLRQVPDVGGAMIAMDPHTGRVLALVGGWDFGSSQFNRATQAKRQPGSSFKPFVYAAALDHGFTPSSLVLDAPFVLNQGPGLPRWKPGNYTNKFYGPSTLRVGLEQSRNLMTVRLAQAVGMDVVVDYAVRLGAVEQMQPVLSMSLGAADTTMLRFAGAYATFVNGGKKVMPTLIDRIQDRQGHTVFAHDKRTCDACASEAYAGGPEPELADVRPQVLDAATAYQIVSMLQGAVERGTGTGARKVGKPLAGKTGTSNDFFDNWFMGFSPDLLVGVYVGFDQPRTLGNKETGGRSAVPVFADFMAEALKDAPATSFRIPPGVRLVRVDPKTGLPAAFGQRNAILEAFRPGTEPANGDLQILDGSEEGDGPAQPSGSVARPPLGGTGAAPATAGTGGLY